MYETLKALTVEELRAKCKDLGLRNYSDLNENELINKIIDSGKFKGIEDKLESIEFERTFKRLIPNPLTIGEIIVSKDEKTFSINENDFSEITIQRLNHSIGTIIEEV
tara:strand:+ start:2800 stop:3123 length:324 start_codon:yes stop_codon:yes gene_type:complete